MKTCASKNNLQPLSSPIHRFAWRVWNKDDPYLQTLSVIIEILVKQNFNFQLWMMSLNFNYNQAHDLFKLMLSNMKTLFEKEARQESKVTLPPGALQKDCLDQRQASVSPVSSHVEEGSW